MLRYERNYLEIDLQAISHNLSAIKGRSEGRSVMAVIKANAYGHGALPLAKAIEDEVAYFGVATVEEACALRDAGIRMPILLLGCADSSQYHQLVTYGITLTIFRASDAHALSAVAAAAHTTARIHLAVDTGMSRIGLMPNEAGEAEAAEIYACKHIEAEGIFSHLSCADERDPAMSYRQISVFEEFLHRLTRRGMTFSYRHLCNSAGFIGFSVSACNMVRAGIALYGIYPSQEVNKQAVSLRPAMSWRTGISYLKRIEKGMPVSYGATYITGRETLVATLPVGYADGYPRSLSGKGEVLIHGCRAPIIGRICMDQMMVDVTDIAEVCEGDCVTLLGRDREECITLEEMAERSGRFFYEIPCLVTDRVPRRYSNIGMEESKREKWNN